jgi:hypothetical protein
MMIKQSNWTRRRFLGTSFLGAIGSPALLGRDEQAFRGLPDSVSLNQTRVKAERIEGLLIGSFIGDALGGPIEFQSAEAVRRIQHSPKQWSRGERLDARGMDDAIARMRLISYGELRPEPESYAHWAKDAPAGTVTDDSRHKLILLHALHQARAAGRWPLTLDDYARAHIEWGGFDLIKKRPGYQELCTDWLREWDQGARWVLGDRDLARALPPERMWAGLPTCSGQMALLPLAALYAGDPAGAYRAAYDLAFFDNGFGKDLNAALVGGLATALITPETIEGESPWESVVSTMRTVDPYRYAAIPWVTRPVVRWMDLADRLVDAAEDCPWALFEGFEREFKNTIKWEAQVPFVVTFAVLKLCASNPLAALQLSIEWGHDTDSYSQLVGALLGARFGAGIFPGEMRTRVREQLLLDYDFQIDDAVRLLHI